MQRGEEEIVELVNTVVDGEATPAEEAELEALMRTSPDTKALYESTREVARRLESSRIEEPPRDLKPSIMNRVIPTPIQRPAGRRRIHDRRVYFALGWAAAAAFVLAVVIFEKQPPTQNTEATMAPIIATFQGTNATLVVRRQSNEYILEPLPRTRPARIAVSWNPQTLEYVAISGAENAQPGRGHVSFTLRDPSQRPGVILRRRPGPESADVLVSVNEAEALRAVVPLR